MSVLRVTPELVLRKEPSVALGIGHPQAVLTAHVVEEIARGGQERLTGGMDAIMTIEMSVAHFAASLLESFEGSSLDTDYH